MRFAYLFSPSHGPLRFVTNHSRVTRVSRTPPCEQRSSKNANMSPFPRCRAKRERKFWPPGDKQKTKAITILSYKNRIQLQQRNCGHFLTNLSLSYWLHQVTRPSDLTHSGLLLSSLKKIYHFQSLSCLSCPNLKGTH